MTTRSGRNSRIQSISKSSLAGEGTARTRRRTRCQMRGNGMGAPRSCTFNPCARIASTWRASTGW
jgi:hypothetical protein